MIRGVEEIDDEALISRQGPEIRFVRVSDGQDLFEFCHELPPSPPIVLSNRRKGQVRRPYAEIGRKIYSKNVSFRKKELLINRSKYFFLLTRYLISKQTYVSTIDKILRPTFYEQGQKFQILPSPSAGHLRSETKPNIINQ